MYVTASYPERSYYGPPTYECPFCGAIFWYQERVKTLSAVSKRKIVYNLCCKSGKIELPPLCPLPEPLATLLNFNGDARSKRFLRQIRSYNSMFAFTSMGAAIDKSINNGNASYVFKINGVVHHRIGTLVPSRGAPPKFAQLYIYDSDNEIQNRLNIFENDCGEIASIIVGDFSAKEYKFGVLVHDKDHGMHQVFSLHPSYMALQYPLLFPYGERGFHLGIKYRNYDGTGRKYATMLEVYRYLIHYRLNEPNPFTCYG